MTTSPTANDPSARYDILPIGREYYADTMTPISALQRLMLLDARVFLLESVEGGERWSRYSFLGFAPIARLRCKDGVVTVSCDGEPETITRTDKPLDVVRRFLDAHRAPQLPELPPFTGGLVGYFGYRCIAYAEPTLQLASGDGEDFDLYYFDKVVAIDHLRQKLWVLVHARVADRERGEARAIESIGRIAACLFGGEAGYDASGMRPATNSDIHAQVGAFGAANNANSADADNARGDTSAIDAVDATHAFRQVTNGILRAGDETNTTNAACANEATTTANDARMNEATTTSTAACAMDMRYAASEASTASPAPLACNLTAAAYEGIVHRAQAHIREGDIFQAVLSRRFEGDYPHDLLDAYRVLRTTNPSPYMVFMRLGETEIMCASPETLVKLTNGTLTTFPIAGSRPRGETPERDEALERELLRDEKELAEHHMLVDLARNDLGRIAAYGSVRVSDRLAVHRFSRIMHLTTTVTATLREGLHALDAVEAMLPAGTLSGAPKVRACEIIEALEPTPRGIYGGAIGYVDLSGNLDACIAIRLAVKRGGRVRVQAGGGIVADSVARAEYEESGNKAAAVIDALMRAPEVAAMRGIGRGGAAMREGDHAMTQTIRAQGNRDACEQGGRDGDAVRSDANRAADAPGGGDSDRDRNSACIASPAANGPTGVPTSVACTHGDSPAPPSPPPHSPQPEVIA